MTGFRHEGPQRARSGAFRSRPGAHQGRPEAKERYRPPQERGGGAMTRNADTTVPRNAPAEQRAAREQRVTADEHEPRPPLEAPRRRPERIKTRLTGDGDRVAMHQLVETEDGSTVWTRNSGAGSVATEEPSRRMPPGTQRLGRASQPTCVCLVAPFCPGCAEQILSSVTY
jgi:hypothetical protein